MTRPEPAGVGTAEMDRATLADNISAFIAAIADGITNGEATRAIMVNVDWYVTAAESRATERCAKMLHTMADKLALDATLNFPPDQEGISEQEFLEAQVAALVDGATAIRSSISPPGEEE